MNIALYTVLDSFWEEFKNSADSPTLIVVVCIGLVALIAIIALLAMLLIPFTLTLRIDERITVKEKHRGNVAIELHAPKKKEGFSFGGWYEDKEYTKPVGSIYKMPSRRSELYAKWIPEEVSHKKLDSKGAFADVSENNRLDGVTEAEVLSVGQIAAKSETMEVSSIIEENFSDPDEEEDESETGEGDEIDNALVTLVTGSKVFVQYRRSFQARLIQAGDEIKHYYNILRNEFLSYIGIKERVSWNYDSFNIGRKQFAKINANTKSLIVYFALNPSEVEDKYNIKDVSEKKRYSNVPVRYKITGSRSLKYALELLEKAAAQFGCDFQRTQADLIIPYEDREALIRKKLIRVYAKRETGESVTEEQLEEYIAEGATVEKMSAYTVTDKIAVVDAENLITDATAKQLIALAEVKELRGVTGKRTYINLDTISAHFKEGDTVDLQALKDKGLIDKKAVSCKILARGVLDKSLTIEAGDFSLPAVKMIVLTGGKVIKIKKN